MKRRLNDHRSSHHDEIDSEGSWAVSYGDMVTLLLCFFILFFSIEPSTPTEAKADETKAKQQSDLLAALMAAVAKPDATEVEAKPKGPGSQKAARTTASLGRQVETGIEADLEKNLGGKVLQAGQKLVVEFPHVSFFEKGTIDLTADGQTALKAFVGKFRPYAGHFHLSVHAYTDPRKVKQSRRRRFKDNLELSALRSIATMRVLESEGLDPLRMRISGRGELRTTALLLDAAYDRRSALGDETGSPEGDAAKDSKKIQKKAYDLARKVVLVIEPENEDSQ